MSVATDPLDVAREEVLTSADQAHPSNERLPVYLGVADWEMSPSGKHLVATHPGLSSMVVSLRDGVKAGKSWRVAAESVPVPYWRDDYGAPPRDAAIATLTKWENQALASIEAYPKDPKNHTWNGFAHPFTLLLGRAPSKEELLYFWGLANGLGREQARQASKFRGSAGKAESLVVGEPGLWARFNSLPPSVKISIGVAAGAVALRLFR